MEHTINYYWLLTIFFVLSLVPTAQHAAVVHSSSTVCPINMQHVPGGIPMAGPKCAQPGAFSRAFIGRSHS